MLPHRPLTCVAFLARGACRPHSFAVFFALCLPLFHLPVSLMVSSRVVPHGFLRWVAGLAQVARLWFSSVYVSRPQVYPSHRVVFWRYSEVFVLLCPLSEFSRASVLLWVCWRSAVLPSGAYQDVVRRHLFPAIALLSVAVLPNCRPSPSFVASDAEDCYRVCSCEPFQVFQLPPWLSFVVVFFLVEPLFPCPVPLLAYFVCTCCMALAFPWVILSSSFPC